VLAEQVIYSIERVIFSPDLNTERVLQLTTEGGREFQAVGAAQLKDRLPMSDRLKGMSRNRTSDDRSD